MVHSVCNTVPGMILEKYKITEYGEFASFVLYYFISSHKPGSRFKH